MNRRVQGFTLIELIIVVVIISILASIGLPAYNAYVERSRRADGQTALLTASQALERCYAQNNTYAGCAVPAESPDAFYGLAATVQTATAFTLTAAPQGQHAGDAECGTLSLTHTGVRDATGTLGTDECW